MRSSLLDYAFSVLAFYKTAAGLRVKDVSSFSTFSYCKFLINHKHVT